MLANVIAHGWATVQEKVILPVTEIEAEYSILPVQLPPSEASRPLPQTQPLRFWSDVNIPGRPGGLGHRGLDAAIGPASREIA